MSVKIRFCGAAKTVTGSCLLLKTPATTFLVDCGLFQGAKTLKDLNYKPFPFAPKMWISFCRLMPTSIMQASCQDW
jgi:metallo-beta-lactamase family protein